MSQTENKVNLLDLTRTQMKEFLSLLVKQASEPIR